MSQPPYLGLSSFKHHSYNSWARKLRLVADSSWGKSLSEPHIFSSKSNVVLLKLNASYANLNLWKQLPLSLVGQVWCARNKFYMFKETYSLSSETKLDKVVVTTAPTLIFIRVMKTLSGIWTCSSQIAKFASPASYHYIRPSVTLMI